MKTDGSVILEETLECIASFFTDKERAMKVLKNKFADEIKNGVVSELLTYTLDSQRAAYNLRQQQGFKASSCVLRAHFDHTPVKDVSLSHGLDKYENQRVNVRN